MYRFAVIGLGYVGLRTALSLSNHKQFVIGYDTNQHRLTELAKGYDCNLDITSEQLKDQAIQFTHDSEHLKEANFYIVDVGTPVNAYHAPDMSTLKVVCRTLSGILKKDDVVVFESTVYPGATDDVFIPLLEKGSQLKSGVDFFVGYSPERIVPGDVEHDVTNIKKIVAGQNKEALDKVMKGYLCMVEADLVPVSSIKVAEAAKLIENIQRDVNIALMNEFTAVMDRLNVNTSEVLMAAGSKWNFLPFKPGFVGGHCISVDPYYLIYKAHGLQVDTDLITTARKVNENFVRFIANKIMSLIISSYPKFTSMDVAILGLSYKKNVSDTRNSLSFNLYSQLTEDGFRVKCCDSIALVRDPAIAHSQVDLKSLSKQQVLVIAVDHDEFKNEGLSRLCEKLEPHGIIIDIPGLFNGKKMPRDDITYWSV